MTRGRKRAVMVSLVVMVLALLAWRVTRDARETGAPSTPAAESAASSRGPAQADARRVGASDVLVAVPRHVQPVRLSAATVRRDPAAAIGTLSGTVVAFASGLPVANATLSFEHGGHAMSVESDTDGHFVLATSELGTYVLATATADGFLPFAPEWGHSPIRFEARRGVHVEGLVIYLVDALEIVATVVRAGTSPRDAVPVAGAQVWVRGVELGERALVPLASRHVSDEHGEVRFVAPDDAVVEASHPEHGRGRAVLDTAAQVTHRLTVRLEREPPASARGDRRIAGTVVDAHGDPVDGALVAATFESRPGSAGAPLHPALEAQSDGDGRFALEDADQGTYQLTATAAGHARAVRDGVSAGVEDVVVRMSVEATLRVRVLDDASSQPIAAATIIVERATGPLTTETLAAVSSYDAEGVVAIGGLEAGACRVIASAPGYAASEPHDAVARTGVPAEVVVRLARGGRIVGRVLSGSATGAPLEGARVTLEGRLGSGVSAVPLETSALTTRDGRFTLSGVVPGLHSIVVWAAHHHGRVRSGLTVATAADVDVGAIDLSPLADGDRPQLELAGIGAVLAADGDALVIGRLIDGGGALAAGLVVGDGILAVDGAPVTELGFGGTIERIRGPEGTSIALRIRRAAGGALESVVVRRTRIRA